MRLKVLRFGVLTAHTVKLGIGFLSKCIIKFLEIEREKGK